MSSPILRPRVAALVVALLLSACTGDGTEPASEESEAAASPSATDVPAEPGPAEEIGLVEGWGPSQAQLDRAVRQARRLTVPELAGQLIVASWSGTRAPVRMVRDLHLGGVIAFSENATSAQQIAMVNRSLRRRVPRPWPLFVGVDQEGGIVERVATTPFPAFMSTGAARDGDLTTRVFRRYGAELAGLGFTVDLAPVADVTTGPADPTIGSRSPGSDPRLVAEHAEAAASGLTAGGVVPVLKHFPGHGSVPADSHLTLPVQERSLRQLRRADLAPFAAAVEAGLPAVMTGHLDVRAVAPRVPSSLSRKVVTGLLREELGFEGLVVTDSLQMAAVTRRRDPAAVAVQAIRAGNDVLLMPPDPAAARLALVRAVRRGTLTRTRLVQSAARQIALLLHTVRDGRGVPAGSSRAASRELSAAAVTVVAGPCEGRLVGDAVVPLGDPGTARAFIPAARAAGLEVRVPRRPPDRLADARPRPERRAGESRADHRDRVRRWQRQERRRREALAAWQADEEERLGDAARVAFAGYGDGPVTGDVAVATDTPYVLASSRARVRVATYGATPGAMSALVDVLTGQATAPGRLPVHMPGVPRAGCGV
ncbi:glycoside hydrolase family 3 protein [Nocardioides coralli]|uniref:glycoside hydrolase family 3 protein n=1 Tax=Nocardioides coralli TaxID=2872154 RepID=UPI001CA40616|nr:glycoside hydrolase family 3 N-terminal domain-containing protein [Nocardioides coralli]QZY29837.1 hypothetical protein K6T13_03885 [Nocardioides coralli]